MNQIAKLLIVCLLSYSSSFANSEVDSLINVAKTSANDSLRIGIYFDLSKHYRNINLDSSLLFIKQGLAIVDRIESDYYSSQGYILLGITYELRSQYDSAIVSLQRAIGFCTDSTLYKQKASASLSLGLTQSKIFQFDEAIKNYYVALELFEKTGIDQGMAMTLNNLGVILKKTNQLDKALDCYLKADDIYKRNNVSRGRSMIQINIAGILYSQQKYTDVIPYLEEAVKLSKANNEVKYLALSYSNLGDTYSELGQYQNSLASFQKALDAIKNLGDPEQEATIYTGIGTQYRYKKEYSLAKKYLSKSLKISLKNNIYRYELINYQELAQVESAINNHSEAYTYLKKYISLSDSLNIVENTKKIAEVESRYQFEKNQLLLENLAKENELKQLEIETKDQKVIRQRYTLIISFSMVAILVFLMLLLHKAFMQIKLAKFKLDNQHKEILQKNEEITSQRDEIEAQRDEITQQRDKVLMQKGQIDDSILYAQFIQNAVLPSTDICNSSLGQHFIIYKPKDVVSGDFYWTTKHNNKLIIAVADCTGHGIPGAFMSMLGISMLNELFRTENSSNAAENLGFLRSLVIDALNQTSNELLQKDGMEMSLALVDYKSKKCQWAGANMPLWIIRKNKPNNAEKTVEEIKPDIMPVGISIKLDSFTNHEFLFETGDKLYFFTDGLTDQYGGPERSKFLTRNLKSLIEKTSNLSMREQGNEIEQAFNQWIYHPNNTFDQIDDVTVLGIEL